MYRHVYQRLKEGGCIGIFPEGKLEFIYDLFNRPTPLQAVAMTGQTFFH